MKNIALSIIVPVYNVEKYLDICVSSIVSQTVKEIEIILVDDGSTDSSGVMCESWASKDSRIKVIHKQNGGLMSAWKRGVIESIGNYVGFVDSDDWVDHNMFEVLLERATKTEADVICSGLLFEYSNGVALGEKIFFDKDLYNREEIKENIFPIMLYNPQTHKRGISPNRVTKLFLRKKLLEVLDLCAESVSIGEDLLTTFSFMTKAQSIAFVKDFCPYHYRINASSMIHTYSASKYDKIRELKRCMNMANTNSDFDFSKQINNDFIQLMLQQLDCEILFSNTSFKNLIKSCRKFYTDITMQEALKNAEINLLSKKNRLYLWLLKNRMYVFLLLIRKLKKVKGP